MDNQKQDVVERIKQANNILVTVNSNPSVDQLAACIGLTVALNKLGKHATAVFSGDVPSTIEFLQPEKTLEKTTDSLRDFIIALDKSKADKLRYKVEDRVVKIFITPYRTSISEKDLDFSQGDFNVDVVIALGVHNQAELDQAITSHGRILHDAVVMSLNVKAGGELGTVNWVNPGASSLSELAVLLVDAVDRKLMDGQIATAFLTGIVAETERFSNAKTSPQTMSISAELMSVGANQQLVATKLQEPVAPPPRPIATAAPQQIPQRVAAALPEPAKKRDDGTLEIAHEEPVPEPDILAAAQKESAAHPAEPEFIPEPVAPPAPQIHIDDQGDLQLPAVTLPEIKTDHRKPMSVAHPEGAPKDGQGEPDESPHMVLQPPSMGGEMSADSAPNDSFSAAITSTPQDSSAAFGHGLEPEEELARDTQKGTSGQPALPSQDEQGSGRGDHDENVDHAEKPASDSKPEIFSTPSSSSSAAPKVALDPEPAAPPNAKPTSTGMQLPDLVDAVAPGFSPQPANDAAQAQIPESHSNETLDQLEHDVHSVHLDEPQPIAPPTAPTQSASNTPWQPEATPAPPVDDARDAVQKAIEGSPLGQLEPIKALNAQPLDLPGLPGLHGAEMSEPTAAPGAPANSANLTPFTLPTSDPFQSQTPAPTANQSVPVQPQESAVPDPSAPPSVPPPMLPPVQY